MKFTDAGSVNPRRRDGHPNDGVTWPESRSFARQRSVRAAGRNRKRSSPEILSYSGYRRSSEAAAVAGRGCI
ncbi:hypothetical protein L484_004740 [Morus notabilis]|uniref:Uncharacterized protein n=1 Tax=Morus notabilis TaxID=981085 RepID=W9SJT8_9ROSA|nr:hypothetical protein L484_004740 [Morus notabilis]